MPASLFSTCLSMFNLFLFLTIDQFNMFALEMETSCRELSFASSWFICTVGYILNVPF